MENIGTAGHLGFSTPSPAVKLEKVLTVTKYGSSSEPSELANLFCVVGLYNEEYS